MNPAFQLKTQPVTFEEFLQQEKDSEIRHEYNDGELVPLEATTKAHNRIKRNIIRQVETEKFEASGCQLFDENVLTQLLENRKAVYPDIVITCDSRDDDPLLVKFPAVIFEILSDSTQRYDKTLKFFRYQRLPSLQQCIFVAQSKMEVRSFLRTEDNRWELTLLEKPHEILEIPVLNVSISLAEIYRNISVVSSEV